MCVRERERVHVAGIGVSGSSHWELMCVCVRACYRYRSVRLVSLGGDVCVCARFRYWCVRLVSLGADVCVCVCVCVLQVSVCPALLTGS